MWCVDGGRGRVRAGARSSGPVGAELADEHVGGSPSLCPHYTLRGCRALTPLTEPALRLLYAKYTVTYTYNETTRQV